MIYNIAITDEELRRYRFLKEAARQVAGDAVRRALAKDGVVLDKSVLVNRKTGRRSIVSDAELDTHTGKVYLVAAIIAGHDPVAVDDSGDLYILERNPTT